MPYDGLTMTRFNHIRLLRYSGLFTWALMGFPIFDLLRREEFGERDVQWIWICYLSFGLSYFLSTRNLGRKQTRVADYILMVIMTSSALGFGFFSGSGLGSILLMVAASVFAWLLTPTLGILWVICSNLVFIPVFRSMNYSWSDALMQSSLYGGFCLFVFATGFVARQQAQARDEQRRLNAELRGTRLLLAESTRMTERTRISRELHDLLGHHLTALSLNLEVAGHLAEGAPKHHITQAHTLAKLLLTDVREVVSQLRETGAMNVGQSLRPLGDNVPGIQIHWDIREPLVMDDPARAHVLLRCTQEIITNAVRHSQARHLHIQVRAVEGKVELDAHDDGRGADRWIAGNGLSGMQERLHQIGGDVRIQTEAGRGFRILLHVPLHEDRRVALAQTANLIDP